MLCRPPDALSTITQGDCQPTMCSSWSHTRTESKDIHISRNRLPVQASLGIQLVGQDWTHDDGGGDNDDDDRRDHTYRDHVRLPRDAGSGEENQEKAKRHKISRGRITLANQPGSGFCNVECGYRLRLRSPARGDRVACIAAARRGRVYGGLKTRTTATTRATTTFRV